MQILNETWTAFSSLSAPLIEYGRDTKIDTMSGLGAGMAELIARRPYLER